MKVEKHTNDTSYPFNAFNLIVQSSSSRPTTNAIMALTVAKYILQPFFYGCESVPADAERLIAAVVICKKKVLKVLLD